MPQEVTNPVAGPFSPNGVTTAFAFEFKISSTSEIAVLNVTAAGVLTGTVSSSLYTVTIAGDGEGGTVTFTTAPDAATYPQLYIVSNPTFDQDVEFSSTGPFNPSSINEPLWHEGAKTLLNDHRIKRSLRFQDYDDTSDVLTRESIKGKFLKGDETTGQIEGEAAVVAYGNDAEAVATRTAMAALTGMSSGDAATLFEAGAAGEFVFYSAADYNTETGLTLTASITADTERGVHVAPASDLTGASGAWVRVAAINSRDVISSWFEDTGGTDVGALQAAKEYVSYLGGGTVLLTRMYALGATSVTFDDDDTGVCFLGRSQTATGISYSGTYAAIDYSEGGAWTDRASGDVRHNFFTNMRITLTGDGADGIYFFSQRDATARGVWFDFQNNNQRGVVCDGSRRGYNLTQYGSWRNLIDNCRFETAAGGVVALADTWSHVGVVQLGVIETTASSITGTWTADEQVRGSKSGATGQLYYEDGTEVLVRVTGRAMFIPGEDIVGLTSGASANTITFDPEHGSIYHGTGNELNVTNCNFFRLGTGVLNLLGNASHFQNNWAEKIKCVAVDINGFGNIDFATHLEPTSSSNNANHWRVELGSITGSVEYLTVGETVDIDGGTYTGVVSYWCGANRVALIDIEAGGSIAVGETVSKTNFSASANVVNNRWITTVLGSVARSSTSMCSNEAAPHVEILSNRNHVEVLTKTRQGKTIMIPSTDLIAIGNDSRIETVQSMDGETHFARLANGRRRLVHDPDYSFEAELHQPIGGVTTNATQTTIYTSQVFSNGRTAAIEFFLACHRTDSSPGTEHAAYKVHAVVNRESGNIAIQNQTATYSYEDDAALDATITVDTSAQTWSIKVTGLASKTLRWSGWLNRIFLSS